MTDTYYIKIDGKLVEISKWAAWVAQDLDGEWWEYRSKPKWINTFSMWSVTALRAGCCARHDGRARFLCSGRRSSDPRNTLFEIAKQKGTW